MAKTSRIVWNHAAPADAAGHSLPSILNPRFKNRGFSFAEVMFAVVILGIGFIMVAAIFPVAIQQTQQTSDDSAGASVAREASNSIAALPLTITSGTSYAGTTVAGISYPTSFPLLPPTVKNSTAGTATVLPAVMVPFVGPRYDSIKASLVLPSNPRLAYIPFYMRDNSSSVAEMVIVAVATQNQSVYGSADIAPTASLAPLFTAPTSITTTAATPGASVTPATIVVNGGASWISEGCFVTVFPMTPNLPQAGRTYLLGRQILGQPTPTFELSPSDGLSEATGGNPAGTDDGLWNTSDDTQDPPATLSNDAIYFPSTLQPTVAYAKLSFPNDSTSGRITLAKDLATAVAATATPTSNTGPLNAATGAFIIVSDDSPYQVGSATTINYTQPALPVSPMIATHFNGRIFRLGALIQTSANVPPGTYELDPAYGLSDSTVRVNSSDVLDVAPYNTQPWARVYIAGGRALSNTANPTQPYTGPAQAVAAYSTFIPVK